MRTQRLMVPKRVNPKFISEMYLVTCTLSLASTGCKNLYHMFKMKAKLWFSSGHTVHSERIFHVLFRSEKVHQKKFQISSQLDRVCTKLYSTLIVCNITLEYGRLSKSRRRSSLVAPPTLILI